MASFDKITEGQILHDYHREKAGNTNMTREGHWRVRIISIDRARRTALCSWNGNPPCTYSERSITKLRVKEKTVKPSTLERMRP